MPFILSEENTAHMSDEELLLHCVREYANEGNYEPYEKDYGVGRPVMRTPYFARNPREYAKQTLALIEKRKESK